MTLINFASGNACFISATSAIFPHRKRKKTSYKFGKRHGPAYDKSFKEGLSDYFEDASNTIRAFVVSLLDFTTARQIMNRSWPTYPHPKL